MKPKTFMVMIAALGATVTLANVAIGGLQNPLGQGDQIFNVAQRIERDDWPKAAITLARKNHFASSRVINAGPRGEVGFVIEAVIADIYGVSQPDASNSFRDFTGTAVAKQILGAARWQGTTLCTGEGFSKCDIFMAWPETAEGQENVVLVGVHLAKGKWALVEEALLNQLERVQP